MIGPLSLEGVPAPGTHNKYPLDLHWRKEPPFWRGNLETAYAKTYPKFCEQVLCYQCGAIPCPYTHDDTEKKQRLVDLEFVKEMAKERREFKQEMEVLTGEVDYLKRLQEEWNRSKMILEGEIRRLVGLNEQNKDLLDGMRRDAYKIQMLEQKCAALEDENANLSHEVNNCKRIMNDQHSEIAALTKNNKQITKEVESSRFKVKKLVIQMDESKFALEKAQKDVKEKDDIIFKMEQDLQNLIDELTQKTSAFEMKESASNKLIHELKLLLFGLNERITDGENENIELKRTIALLREEIDMLKKKLSSDTRFRQFVDVKREYNTLKDVTGTLAQKVHTYENEIPLPVVKKGGRTAKTRSNVSGAGTRPRSTILSRPKSARTPIRPPTADSSVGNMADFDDYDDLSRPQSSASASRSGGPSRSQSALSNHTSNYGDESLNGAGLSTRLTPMLRGTRPKSSIKRSSSALSNPRTVRIMESPIEMTTKYNAKLGSSPEPLQSALKAKYLSDVEIHFDAAPQPESHPECDVRMREQDGAVARPSSPVQDGANAEYEAVRQDDDDENEIDDNLSDMSFADLDMDDVIEL